MLSLLSSNGSHSVILGASTSMSGSLGIEFAMEDDLFRPLMTREEALLLSREYNYGNDLELERAGDAIRNGDYARRHFDAIFKWKTRNRGKSRPQKNSDAEIAEALRIVVAVKSPRLAISTLCGLVGVAIPVASAIMTSIRPSEYTIIDFRALEALDQDADQVWSLAYYERYLSFCRALAAEWGMSLRDLDKALWMWSKKNGDVEVVP